MWVHSETMGVRTPTYEFKENTIQSLTPLLSFFLSHLLILRFLAFGLPSYSPLLNSPSTYITLRAFGFSIVGYSPLCTAVTPLQHYLISEVGTCSFFISPSTRRSFVFSSHLIMTKWINTWLDIRCSLWTYKLFALTCVQMMIIQWAVSSLDAPTSNR